MKLKNFFNKKVLSGDETKSERMYKKSLASALKEAINNDNQNEYDEDDEDDEDEDDEEINWIHAFSFNKTNELCYFDRKSLEFHRVTHNELKKV